MKNNKFAAFLLIAMLGLAANALATAFDLPPLNIQFVRAVGQYQEPQFNNTIELWFTTPLPLPAGSPCVDARRVYIDSKNYHLVAAAYMAFSKGRSVHIALDDTLPIRAGACEVTYLDVLAQ